MRGTTTSSMHGPAQQSPAEPSRAPNIRDQKTKPGTAGAEGDRDRPANDDRAQEDPKGDKDRAKAQRPRKYYLPRIPPRADQYTEYLVSWYKNDVQSTWYELQERHDGNEPICKAVTTTFIHRAWDQL